jgi:hypothetical protein
MRDTLEGRGERSELGRGFAAGCAAGCAVGCAAGWQLMGGGGVMGSVMESTRWDHWIQGRYGVM